MRRVVVTGMGMVSPLGVGVDHNWKRITAGHSGISNITIFDASDISSQIAGQVPRGPGVPAEGAFNADLYVLPKEQKKMDIFILFAMGAAKEAIEDSGWKPETEEDRYRTGVLIGSSIGGMQTIYESSVTLHEKGPRRLSPFTVPAMLINLA